MSADKKPGLGKLPAMTAVKSSSLSEIGHDGAALFVRFTSGKAYRYQGVTTKEFEELQAAKSVGQHFAQLRPKYDGKPVEEAQ